MSIFFVFLGLSGTFLLGCSQDNDNSATPQSAYSLEQKAEILALAEKYGLNYTFADGCEIGEKCPKILTIEELEYEFKQLSQALSRTYTMIGTKDGEAELSIPISLRRLKNPSESGAWSKDKYLMGTDYKITVSVTWDISSPSVANTTVVSDVTSYRSSPLYLYYEQEGTATLNPSSDLITFSGKGKYWYSSSGYTGFSFTGSLWADDIPIHGDFTPKFDPQQ